MAKRPPVAEGTALQHRRLLEIHESKFKLLAFVGRSEASRCLRGVVRTSPAAAVCKNGDQSSYKHHDATSDQACGRYGFGRDRSGHCPRTLDGGSLQRDCGRANFSRPRRKKIPGFFFHSWPHPPPPRSPSPRGPDRNAMAQCADALVSPFSVPHPRRGGGGEHLVCLRPPRPPPPRSPRLPYMRRAPGSQRQPAAANAVPRHSRDCGRLCANSPPSFRQLVPPPSPPIF